MPVNHVYFWRGTEMGQAICRGRSGFDALRRVDDDASEVTRELVKLYMLEGPPEVVRDGVMFAVVTVL